MDQTSLVLARPVVLGDALSFDPHPKQHEDLLTCTVYWEQNGPRKERFVVFKAKNLTAGDTKPLVPVFVQKSYYTERFGTAKDVAEFVVTAEWQYGQRDETGADRFVVLQDQDNKPYQHRFIESWLAQLGGRAHDALCVFGYAQFADKLDQLSRQYLGDPLHSYASLIVQSGDVLLVPSELKWYSFGNLQTIEWEQSVHRREEYYSFTVVNTSQKGQDVMFFIQKDWWEGGSTSDNHISKIATKNANGDYEFKIDAKLQYGQADSTGKNRWVVYHDKQRKPYQHRFVKSTLHSIAASAVQVQAIAGNFGLTNTGADVDGIFKLFEGIVGNSLHTFN